MVATMMVPLDGSPFAEEALPLAREVARRRGAELHLVHVIRPAPDVDLKMPDQDLEWNLSVREGADAYLEEKAEALRAEGISALTAVLEGKVAQALDEYAEEQGVDLMVLTTHGAGGLRRWWLGSVTDGLLRTSDRNLLLVRPWDDTGDRSEGEPRFRKIVVPLDGSELAESALGPAREFAGLFDSKLLLVRVVPAPVELTAVTGVPGVPLAGEGHRTRVDEAETYLGEVRSRMDGDRTAVAVVEASGAAEGVVEQARKEGADLIALSTHGRGGLARAVLGSVTDKVIRTSHLPVLVARPEEGAA